MPAPTQAQTRPLFFELQPGDKIEVEHEVKVGLKRWNTLTKGTVVKIDRTRHGLHFRRSGDDKVYSDEILLKRDSGELTTIRVDEFTTLRRV